MWYIDLGSRENRYRKKLSTNRATAQKIHDDIIKNKSLTAFGLADNQYDFAELCKRFLTETTARVNYQTAHDYKVLLDGIADRLQHVPIENVREVFNDYLLERQKGGLSLRRLNLTIELARRVFRYGIETNVIPSDPIMGIRKFTVVKKLRRALLPNEIKSLLENSGKFRNIWLVFVGTGLRRSELVELKWKDVDIDKGLISIAKHQHGKGIGRIPMSEEIQEVFRGMVKGQPEKHVFTTKLGTPYRNNLSREFYRCLKKAGVNREGVSIHSLRYTFATTLASQNKHPRYIQALMRHKHISTSMDIYTDVYKEDLMSVVKNLKFS